MGVFDSVCHTCPHCHTEQEENFKPGYQKRYIFPDDAKIMPISYLRTFQNREFECYSCKKTYKTDVRIEIKIINPILKKD